MSSENQDLGRINAERIRFQLIPIVVPANSTASIHFATNTDKSYDRVIGVCLQKPVLYNDKNIEVSDEANFYLLIDREEIFPMDFDSRLLEYSENIPVDDRFYTEKGAFNEKARGSEVKLIYQPKVAVPQTYTVYLVLKLKGKISA